MPSGSVRNVVDTSKNATKVNMMSISGTMFGLGERRRSRTMATSLTPHRADNFQNLRGAPVHVGHPPVDDAAEPVVHRHRRNGDAQAGGRGNERLRNA